MNAHQVVFLLFEDSEEALQCAGEASAPIGVTCWFSGHRHVEHWSGHALRERALELPGRPRRRSLGRAWEPAQLPGAGSLQQGRSPRGRPSTPSRWATGLSGGVLGDSSQCLPQRNSISLRHVLIDLIDSLSAFRRNLGNNRNESLPLSLCLCLV